VTLERVLAVVLGWGTWLASAVIAAGLVLGDMRVTAGGVASLIALPVVRVAIMLGAFARARDGRAAAIAALVLVVLAAGFAAGR
jgi:uncharacterized membrane protein